MPSDHQVKLLILFCRTLNFSGVNHHQLFDLTLTFLPQSSQGLNCGTVRNTSSTLLWFPPEATDSSEEAQTHHILSASGSSLTPRGLLGSCANCPMFKEMMSLPPPDFGEWQSADECLNICLSGDNSGSYHSFLGDLVESSPCFNIFFFFCLM